MPALFAWACLYFARSDQIVAEQQRRPAIASKRPRGSSPYRAQRLFAPSIRLSSGKAQVGASEAEFRRNLTSTNLFRVNAGRE